MKPNQQFIRRLSEGTAEETWVIDAVGNCGHNLFRDVVIIHSPKSINPGIQIRGITGLRGLKKSIQLIEKERKKFGLTTLR